MMPSQSKSSSRTASESGSASPSISSHKLMMEKNSSSAVNYSNDVADDKENQIYQYTPQRPTPRSQGPGRQHHRGATNLLTNYNYLNKPMVQFCIPAETPTQGDVDPNSEQYYHSLVSPSDSSTYTTASTTTPDDKEKIIIGPTELSLSDMQPLDFDSTLIAACTPDAGSLDAAETSMDDESLIGHIQDYPSFDEGIDADANSSVCPSEREDDKPSIPDATNNKTNLCMEGFLADSILSPRPNTTTDPSELNLVTAAQYISGCKARPKNHSCVRRRREYHGPYPRLSIV